MRFSDRQKKQMADFKQLLPLIDRILAKIKLTNKPKIYHFNKVDFIIRLNGDIIEMALADEAPIFPTLAFRNLSTTRADLLYYRICNNFHSKLNEAIK
jgi:50S ribosomal subunit-associated GTPase HflX